MIALRAVFARTIVSAKGVILLSFLASDRILWLECPVGGLHPESTEGSAGNEAGLKHQAKGGV